MYFKMERPSIECNRYLKKVKATKLNQRTAKSQFVAELGPAQPKLVVSFMT